MVMCATKHYGYCFLKAKAITWLSVTDYFLFSINFTYDLGNYKNYPFHVGSKYIPTSYCTIQIFKFAPIPKNSQSKDT